MKTTPENAMLKKVNRAMYESMRLLITKIASDYSLNPDDMIATYLPSLTTPQSKKKKKTKEEDYIETEEFVYKGRTYLVDDNNVVYTNNINKPTIMGRRMPDGVIEFSTPEDR